MDHYSIRDTNCWLTRSSEVTVDRPFADKSCEWPDNVKQAVKLTSVEPSKLNFCGTFARNALPIVISIFDRCRSLRFTLPKVRKLRGNRVDCFIFIFKYLKTLAKIPPSSLSSIQLICSVVHLPKKKKKEKNKTVSRDLSFFDF